jgi:hypothetical protein
MYFSCFCNPLGCQYCFWHDAYAYDSLFPFSQERSACHMAPQHVQWGTITLHPDNETFRTAFSQGRNMSVDDSEDDFPHVASSMNTLDAAGMGGYLFDILGFAPSLHERSSYR